MGLKDEAEDLALAIRVGLESVAAAVAWADAQLAACDQPPHALIEISLAAESSWRDVVQLLRTVPGFSDEPSAVHRLMARLTEALDQRHAEADRIPDILVAMEREQLLGRDAAQVLSNYETACALADAGYLPWEEVELDVRAVLQLCAQADH